MDQIETIEKNKQIWSYVDKFKQYTKLAFFISFFRLGEKLNSSILPSSKLMKTLLEAKEAAHIADRFHDNNLALSKLMDEVSRVENELVAEYNKKVKLGTDVFYAFNLSIYVAAGIGLYLTDSSMVALGVISTLLVTYLSFSYHYRHKSRKNIVQLMLFNG